MRCTPGALVLGLLCLPARPLAAGPWPQFHGPNATGLAAGDDRLPAEVGPDKNLRWKTPLPPGHSSPVVFGDRVFLTWCVEEDRARVLGCFDRRDGKLLWRFPVGGRVISGPMTYSLGGKQYVEVAAGNSLFVFSLK